MALNQNDISLKVGFDINRFTSELHKTNSLLSQWSVGIQRQIQYAFGVTAILYKLQQGVTQTVERMATFEHSMKAVEAVTGATGAELEKLRDNAIKMAAAFSANEIAQFELEMSRMGFTAKQVTEMSQAVINLATATGEDLAKSGEIAGATMKMFGLQATDMTRITDTMSGALNLSSLKLSDFAESIKYVGPVANQAGISLERTSAMIAVLANAGIKGSMAGTSLRRIITDLGMDGELTAEKLKKFITSQLTANEAHDEFGRIAQSVAIVLSNSGKTIEEMTRKLENMNGITDKMATIMQDDMIGAWNRLNGAWDGVIQRGTFINRMIKDLLDSITFKIKTSVAMTEVWAKVISSVWDFLTYGGWKGKFTENITTIEKEFGKITPLAKAFWDALNGENALKKGKGVDPMVASMDAFREAHPTIERLNLKIKDLKENIDKSFDPTSIHKWKLEIEAAELAIFKLMNAPEIAKAQKHATKDSDASGFLPGTQIKPQTSDQQGRNLTDMLTENLEKMSVKFEKIAPRVKLLLEKLGFTSEQTAAKMSNAFLNMGVDISNGLANAISGTLTFAESMRRMAMSVIDSMEKMALAYFIGDGFKKFGIGGVAAAVIGFGVIKGLFARIGHTSSAVSSGPSNYSRIGDMQPINVNINGTLTARGPDLVYVLDKQGYKAGRVGG